MHMLYVCVLCASYGSSICCIQHDLQFVNDCRGCKKRPHGKGILQSRFFCLVGRNECLLLFTPSCYDECFYYLQRFVYIVCEFGSKIHPEPMGALPCVVRSKLLAIFRRGLE